MQLLYQQHSTIMIVKENNSEVRKAKPTTGGRESQHVSLLLSNRARTEFIRTNCKNHAQHETYTVS